MTSETTNNIEKTINNPLDQGKQDLLDIFNKNKNLINQITFISKISLKYDKEEYSLPNQNKFLYNVWNKTFTVEKKKNKIDIKLIANFTVESVKECIFIYNDKKGQKPSKFYLATLKNAKGKIEQDVEIVNNSKSDYKQFQTALNESFNGFTVNMTEAEFKTFVDKYISPKVVSTVKFYKNSGVLADNTFLYKNALVIKDKIIRADSDGYIKVDDKTYIKAKNDTLYLPKLATSDRSPKEIANEFISNIIECWDKEVVLPLITLGHMAMAIYFEDFIKGLGVPTLLLYGSTGTGKSTLINTGLAIFGLTKETMSSGGSTAKSNEYFTSNYNGINVCIDDIKGETLKSSNFTTLIKGIYKGISRRKMLPYGRGVDTITTCSPLAYSTNESLPELQEVINRMNVIEIFANIFKADQFKYHELNNANSHKLDELSLILPELIKLPKEYVMQLYKDLYELLKSSVPDTQGRVISNIAYAYTGAVLLLEIADITIDNLKYEMINYANQQILRYESIKTPVEKLLESIAVLTDIGILGNDKHYKIYNWQSTTDNTIETRIKFHKETIISVINKYYSNDKSKQINSDSFLSYAKNHKRYRGYCSSRYDGDKNKVLNSVVFDISGIDNFNSFVSTEDDIIPQSAEDFRKITS